MWLILGLAAGGGLWHWLRPAPAPAGPAPEELFGAPYVWRIHLQAPEAAVRALEQEPRREVRVTVECEGRLYTNVQAHLKGATGSFRPVGDKPSWTLKFPAPGLRGSEKIHLNNSVEDGSYLCEWLGSEVFRAGGVPAARTTHALVSLNGRRLGLYVVKEGYNRGWLERQGQRGVGLFYEPVQAQDITGRLEMVFGPAQEAGAGLRELAAAAGEPDLSKRWEQLGVFLDREHFARFLAGEVLLGHRDGYGLARNNYRLYYDTAARRAWFIPHGMDNLLGTPDFPWRPYWRGLVARAFMEIPEGSALYRASLERWVEREFQPERWKPRLEEQGRRLAAVLPRAEGRAVAQAAAGLAQRLEQRHASLRRQLAEPAPAPPVFSNGVARLSGWRAVDVPEGGRMEVGRAPDGRAALMIQAGPRTAATWRTRVWLEAGLYVFTGEVWLEGVAPLANLRQQGAGLGVEEVPGPPHKLTGEVRGKRLEVPFTIAPPGRSVELRCELFARQGTAWFVSETLVLRKR
ncbi:MAG: CotH kinase family protein [Verrucomicrobiae bacterium]|nr:CotH kinase family protein [Verrucomicrobiae bacterium]